MTAPRPSPHLNARLSRWVDGQVQLEVDGLKTLRFEHVGPDILLHLPVRDPYDQLDTITYRWDSIRRVWDRES